jgi:hypothetical protein
MPGSPTTPDLRVLALTLPAVLPSVFAKNVGVRDKIFSRLNGWPVHSPADASPPPLRATAHGLGPMWIATPSSYRTCTDYSLPVSRRTAKYAGGHRGGGRRERARSSSPQRQSPDDFDSAFKAITTASADALIILPSPMFYVNYRRLVDLADRSRLPTMYVFKEAVEGGGLISYGADIPNVARLACKYVSKILNGAKPGDLPVQQPVKFELAINLKTAKVLNLTILRRCSPSPTRSSNETARLHRGARGRGGVADGGAGAAAHAGDRISRPGLRHRLRALSQGLPTGTWRGRLR